MIRIVASSDLKDILIARGIAADVRDRIMRWGQVTPIKQPMKMGTVRDENGNNVPGLVPDGPPTKYYDILLERDSNDLPDALVNFLRNNAAILYVAEWDGKPDTVDAEGNPVVSWKIWKGSDPTNHRFAGWPV